jgi:hypothetical protein
MEALVYLVHVQEGPNPPLFGPWSFDKKVIKFVSVFASLVKRKQTKANKGIQSNLGNTCGGKVSLLLKRIIQQLNCVFYYWKDTKRLQTGALKATSFSFQKKDKYKAYIKILFLLGNQRGDNLSFSS